MKKMISVALLLAPAALAAQTPAPPQQAVAVQTAAAQPQTRTASAAEDPNERICRRERETGSRLAARTVCRTRAEWELEQRELRNDIARAIAAKPSSGQ